MADGVTGEDRAMGRFRHGQRPEGGEQRGNAGMLLGGALREVRQVTRRWKWARH
jgi:hypothetical protein